MDVTIGSFHARLRSSEDSPLWTALRQLRRLADLAPPPGDVVEPAAEWGVWTAVGEAAAEAPAPCAI